MQALKVLVIVMGIMIVAAIGVIVVTIINRSKDLAERRAPYERSIEVPAGDLVGMAAGPNQVTLRYRLPDGSERLVVIDTERGRVRGTLDLVHP